jgi:hypothetical protein
VLKSDCQLTVPRCHIKRAARTDFTGKYGLPLSAQDEKTFGSDLTANCTFGKECWRSSSFKLRQSSSESGRFMALAVNHFIPRAESGQLCERGRMHPFCEEKPCFGLVSISREM